MDDSNEFEEQHEHQREERPRGVPKARLSDLDLELTIDIYHKTHHLAPNALLVKSFPKEAATLFCTKIFKAIAVDERDGRKSKAYTINGGDRTALLHIFDWIKECVTQQSIVKYPDIPEPEDDPFAPTINVIIAADLLDVPAGSLSYFVEKRLGFIARKHLMPFSQVQKFYDSDSDYHSLGLSKIACVSIFNAWWDHRLDASVDPQAMEELSDLRYQLTELDSDLHIAFEEKKKAVEKSQLEKKLKREAEKYGGGTTTDVGGWVQDTVCAADSGGWDSSTGGGWNNPEASGGTSETLGDWNSTNTPVTVDLNQEKAFMQDGDKVDDSNSVGDWADEVNANQNFAQPVHFNTPIGGW